MPLQLSRARRDDPHVRAVEAADARLADAFAFPVVLEDELLAVIELHSGAGEELTPQLAATLSAIGAQLAHFLARRRARLGSSPVSEREREVLQLAAGGASIAAIAENLTLSPSTVKTHLEHIYEKLDVTTRSGAVAQGLRTGLIE